MASFPVPIEKTLEELSRLPGVGRKSAMRILYHLLKGGSGAIEGLENALRLLKENIEKCPLCRGYKEKTEECPICNDPRRDPGILCVVESTQDLHLIDSTSAFNGSYFVLHGLISPFKGIGPEALGLEELRERLDPGTLREVIIATPYTAEGEATSSCILSMIEGTGIRASRIGMGIPIGSDLSFVDPETLSRALSGRREVK